jgi:hypothetical protein
MSILVVPEPDLDPNKKVRIWIRNTAKSIVFCCTVCGIWTQEEVPEGFKFSSEKNVVLDIYNITIHPNFAQGQAG